MFTAGPPAPPYSADDEFELLSVATRQYCNIMADKTFQSDVDLPFLTAHFSPQPSSSSFSSSSSSSFSSSRPPQYLSLSRASNFNVPIFGDARRRFQGQRSVSGILREPGYSSERPYVEDCSKSANGVTGIQRRPDCRDKRPYVEHCSKRAIRGPFRLYFKGLLRAEKVRGSFAKKVFGGIGVVICDSSNELFFQKKKPLKWNEMSPQEAEIRALIEGLNLAIELGLKHVELCFHCDRLYELFTGRSQPTEKDIVPSLNQVYHLRNQFTYCDPSFVGGYGITFAYDLAREAIASQNIPTIYSRSRNLSVVCPICLEDKDVAQMFPVDGCSHSYCFSCMKQHLEVKLLHGMVPKCPHEGCNSQVKIDSCQKFLTPNLIEIMGQQLKEAAIPGTEKVYCPYPKCSALMSSSEVLQYSEDTFVGAARSGARRCIKCGGHFCINCRVPWHQNMTCSDFKLRNPDPPAEDAELKSLAARNLWRQCVKCNHMIELAAGCFHITCSNAKE